MNDQGYGYSSQIMLGINYVTELKNSGMNIYAMNLSLGNSSSYIGSEGYNMYHEALGNAYNNEILPVVAAGNDGVDATGTAPANIEFVITVSAVGQSGSWYYRPSWSNYGSFIDVSAPGHLIVSAQVGGGTVAMSGTSMATPHVSAAVALLVSDSINNYTMSQIESLLKVNTIDLGDNGWDSFFGEGMVNLEYAFAELISSVTFSNTETDCSDPFYLTLSSSTANAKIYYTTDGTIPTISTGTLYSDPILVNTTQNIKARAYVIVSGDVVKYSKISQMTYCFYGQDVAGAFSVSTDGVLLLYTGVLTDVIVPKVVDGITITSVGTNAFTSTSVTSVTLSSTIKSIGTQAFAGCSTIEKVYGPNVTLIDMYAFNGCTSFKYLTDEYFPNLLTISKYAFAGCYDITSISLSNLELLDYSAFYMDQHGAGNITSVNLPNVKIIGVLAFFNCYNITTINLPSVKIIGSNAFRACDLIDIYLPSVKYIGSYSFYDNSNILTVDMPEVLVVGSYSFYYFATKLHTVKIPKAQRIGAYAFRLCTSLENLVIEDLVEVGSWAFNECKLQELNAEKLRYIGRRAFSENKLTHINVPSVVMISSYAFSYNPTLQKVYLSSCIEAIDNRSFSSYSTSCLFYIYGGTVAHDYVISNGYSYVDLLTNNSDFVYNVVNDEIHITGYVGESVDKLVIPSYINNLPVTKICTNAFKNYTNIYTLNVAYLRDIEDGAFEGCVNLNSVILDRIESIGNNAFRNCINLKEVNILNIVRVGDYAFYGCSNLTEIKFSTGIAYIGENALGYGAEEILIPAFVIYGYDDTPAKTYADSKGIIFRAMFNDLTRYYYNTYSNKGRTEIYISFVDSYTTGNIILPSYYSGKKISRIGPDAFKDCCFITGIILPDTITSIGKDAFNGCTMLETINLNYVTKLEGGSYGIFKSCTSLKYISLPLVENIPKSTFHNCDGLLEVEIPNVKTIGELAFYGCYSLRKVVCPKVEEIGWAAFSCNEKLEYIDTLSIRVLGTIHDTGTITGSVFTYCGSLSTMYLPKIETMGLALFGGSSVNRVVIGKSFKTYNGDPIRQSITIYGYAGSTAESYANENGNTFIPIDEFNMLEDLPDSVTKDINDDCMLSVSVSGFELKYQWYTTLTNSTDGGTQINGETSSSLSIDTSITGICKYYVRITNWDGEEITSNICTVTITSEEGVFSIVARAGENGTIYPAGYIKVNEGESQTFTFSANVGYHVSAIYVDGILLDGTACAEAVAFGYTFSDISDYHTLAVEFAINTYTITVIQSSHGSITPNGVISVNYGDKIVISITPEYGYYISKLVVDGNNIASGDLSKYTFIDIADNHTFTAEFKEIETVVYTINHWQETLNPAGATSHNGKYYTLEEIETLSGKVGTYTCAQAKSYEGFTAIPFNQVQISVEDIEINIYYIRNSYNLSLAYSTGVTNVVGAGKYVFGEMVTISADILDGYGFNGWESSTNAFENIDDLIYTFEMPCYSFTLTATATMKTYTITIVQAPNGTIASSKSIVNYNEDLTITLTPDTHYHIDDVIVDEEGVGAQSTYVFVNIRDNHTITAIFAKNTYSISIINGDNGEINCDNPITDIEEGDSRTFTLSPEENYVVDSVTIDGVEIEIKDNSFVINDISSDLTIEITYKERVTPESQYVNRTNLYIAKFIGIGIIAFCAILFIYLIVSIIKRSSAR